MNSISYAVVALVFFGLADFVYKRAADGKSRPHQFLLSQSIFFAPLTLALAWLTGNLVWTPYILWGALGGLFTFVGLYCFSRSLIGGAVSLNAPLFRLNFLFTAALAIGILGEPLTVLKAVGLVSALLSAWLLVGGAVNAGAMSTPGLRNSLLLALVATLALGAANFCHKIGLMHGVAPATALVGQVWAFAPLTVIAAFAIDRKIAIPAKTLKLGFTAAVILLVGLIAFLLGLSAGEASVVAPIAQMGFIVTAGLGVTILGEPLTGRKIFGLGTAVLALAAFAI
jgi:uncharacterized membrane protein